KKTISTANSVVIAFRPHVLRSKNVRFNINFGLGGTFQIANEYVFLRNALKAGLRIYFKAAVILSHPFYSSGKAFRSDKLIFARAALFYKYSGFLGYFRLCKYLYLLYRQGHLKRNELIPKFKVGRKGIKTYKDLVRKGLD
ncbi:MAG: hypothetical protein KJO77_05570, partial [Bacteroidia bacterium]|nr:hypothetical protein [Bacteroidia bacterium]